MTDTALAASANPFASRFIDALPFRGPDWPDLIERLSAQGGRGALIGPHGSGKTTLIEQLGDRLASEGWAMHRYRTTEEGGGLGDLFERAFRRNDVVLLDGAGHIGALAWRRILRHCNQAGRFVVTAHRPGRLPCLHRCETSLALLDALVTELAPAIAQDMRPHSHALYARHGGNLRDVLRALYDHCAGLS